MWRKDAIPPWDWSLQMTKLQLFLTCSLTPPIVCMILQCGDSRLLWMTSFLFLPQRKTLLKIQRDCKGYNSHSSLVPLQGSKNSLWYVLPLNKNIDKKWIDEDNRRLQDILLEGAWNTCSLGSWKQHCISRFGKTMSLTFLENSVLSSILCVRFSEIFLCFQL